METKLYCPPTPLMTLPLSRPVGDHAAQQGHHHAGIDEPAVFSLKPSQRLVSVKLVDLVHAGHGKQAPFGFGHGVEPFVKGLGADEKGTVAQHPVFQAPAQAVFQQPPPGFGIGQVGRIGRHAVLNSAVVPEKGVLENAVMLQGLELIAGQNAADGAVFLQRLDGPGADARVDAAGIEKGLKRRVVVDLSAYHAVFVQLHEHVHQHLRGTVNPAVKSVEAAEAVDQFAVARLDAQLPNQRLGTCRFVCGAGSGRWRWRHPGSRCRSEGFRRP